MEKHKGSDVIRVLLPNPAVMVLVNAYGQQALRTPAEAHHKHEPAGQAAGQIQALAPSPG